MGVRPPTSYCMRVWRYSVWYIGHTFPHWCIQARRFRMKCPTTCESRQSCSFPAWTECWYSRPADETGWAESDHLHMNFWGRENGSYTCSWWYHKRPRGKINWKKNGVESGGVSRREVDGGEAELMCYRCCSAGKYSLILFGVFVKGHIYMKMSLLSRSGGDANLRSL